MGIPRLARLLILSTLLITIPTLYLLYPHRETILQTTQGYLEKGGIDSSHWRDPLPPPGGIDHELEKLEHEEVRDWEGQDVLNKGPVDEGVSLVSEDLSPEGSADSGVGPESSAADKQGSTLSIGGDVLEGGVIMPKLENATAKWVNFLDPHLHLTKLISRAELGRAAWKVLHLMTLRYPDVRLLFAFQLRA
jgi:hypothetical protein